MISQCCFNGRNFKRLGWWKVLESLFRFYFCKFDEPLKYKYEIINAPLFNEVMAYVLHLNFKLSFVSWIVPNQ
jgi:hypothetical protein